MRPIERIPVVLEHIPMKKYLTSLGFLEEREIDAILPTIDMERIREFWMENPDYRLTQVLIALSIIPNIPGFWFYTEEYEWLLESGHVEARDILFWTSTMDENGDPLAEPITRPIKDLDSDHIKAIMSRGFIGESHPYKEVFEDELERRGVGAEMEGFSSCENCGLPELSVSGRSGGEILCDECYNDMDYLHS